VSRAEQEEARRYALPGPSAGGAPRCAMFRALRHTWFLRTEETSVLIGGEPDESSLVVGVNRPLVSRSMKPQNPGFSGLRSMVLVRFHQNFRPRDPWAASAFETWFSYVFQDYRSSFLLLLFFRPTHTSAKQSAKFSYFFWKKKSNNCCRAMHCRRGDMLLGQVPGGKPSPNRYGWFRLTFEIGVYLTAI
jgi:hypothetical protein